LEPSFVRSDMWYWRLRPDARLRPRVLCYFAAFPAPGESASKPRFQEELLLPDGYSELVFNLADGYERWPVGDGTQRQVMQPSYIIGGRSHSVLTRALGEVKVVGVKLDPRCLRQLIGAPLAEFRDSTLTLSDLNHQLLLQLENAVGNAKGIAEIGTLFDSFFLRLLGVSDASDSLVDELVRRIQRERGTLPLLRWMRETRIDSSNIERRFCAWMGMTPKRFARIVRFKHSYHRLLRGDSPVGEANLQLDGYYDHSHFHRDFKYFFGAAPTTRLSGALQQETGVSDHLLQGEFGHSRR
jgi:AraC-like DNA-binding protein